MRKVAEEIAKAIKSKTAKTVGNTCVVWNATKNEWFVQLHGNLIMTGSDKSILVNLQMVRRWDTVTTRSRVNDLCRLLVGHSLLSHKDGVLLVNGERCSLEFWEIFL